VDEGSADMQTETQKPQNQKNQKNCPKHGNLLYARLEEGDHAVWFGGRTGPPEAPIDSLISSANTVLNGSEGMDLFSSSDELEGNAVQELAC
jgi:hypothetical protein